MNNTAKTEVEVRFTFPLDEVLLQHKGRAERKAAVYSGFPKVLLNLIKCHAKI